MKEEFTKGSENVFADLGCVDAEEKLAKAELCFIINNIVKERKLTQKHAAKILGVDQPKISALMNGKLSGFSIERLFGFLRALDQRIDIVVSRNPHSPEDRSIHVAYA